MRNRRFSFWCHPLHLLSILFLLGGSAGAYAADTYDPATNILTIPVGIVGGTAYTNVRITVGSVISVGGGPAANAFDTYDAATNQLTIPSVLVGATTYTNVVITVGSVISIGGSAPAPASTTAPMLVLVNPLDAAIVGQAYSANVVAGILPPSRYTYMIDTLANGVLPTGMTLHIDGTLSGTPFATGKADVNGNQVPNTYTFGVCAVDTLSRSSTTPCPQTSITVYPAAAKYSGSFSGSFGTATGNTGCQWALSFSGTMTLTIATNSDGTIDDFASSGSVPINIVVTPTFSPPGVNCAVTSAPRTATGLVSGTDSNLSGTFVASFFQMNFEGMLNRNSITGSATASYAFIGTGTSAQTALISNILLIRQ